MNQGLIPARYAKALYEVAKEKDCDRKLYEQLRQLTDTFAAEPKLNETIANPFVDNSDKAALIYSACHADDSDSMLSNFIKLLEQNRRMGMVREIAVAYQDVYRRDKRIHRVRVSAAAPLAKEAEDRLKKLITDHLAGDTMEYSFVTDPDLIGGFVVTIDNRQLDASVKNELKQLRLKLLSNK
ncbi:MAG: F0F1 ATP synthase subunit delta [Muribaculaceae bacterium]|nr:F0F1 ATP synthase subunit delta [Muribaculaceae bacterium]